MEGPLQQGDLIFSISLSYHTHAIIIKGGEQAEIQTSDIQWQTCQPQDWTEREETDRGAT